MSTTRRTVPVVAESQSARSLREVVDDIACAQLAWVLVDLRGDVLVHAPGPGACPETMATAIVSRRASPLEQVWHSRTRATRSWVTAADAGDGLRVWTTGAKPSPHDLARIRVARAHEQPPVSDPIVADLLHARGLQRVGSAPRAKLVACRPGPGLSALSHQAAALAGSHGTVHVDGQWMYLALAPEERAYPLIAQLTAQAQRALRAGVAEVPDGATDWSATARLTRRLADIATRTGRPVATVQQPEVLTQLVMDEAAAAITAYLHEIGASPLAALHAYDTRTGGTLTEALRAWLQAGRDVTAAAGSLGVHHNTLRYRIRRAGEISAFDLDQPDVQTALRLLLHEPVADAGNALI